jgi:putative (di)nucleoside polyphosphate hydrolase
MKAERPYRQSVGIMLINAENRIWIGRRVASAETAGAIPYRWQMPQGGITQGEDPANAALRELHEETGVRSARIIAEASGWLAYDFPQEVLNSLNGKYRGQKMKWFAVRFFGGDSEIYIDADHGGGPEFDAWRWAAIDELLPLVVPFKRAVYEAVVNEFRPLVAAVS